MLTLVYKDILCQKRSLWLALFYAGFMHVAFFTMPDVAAYTAATVGITYVFVLGACALEEKNRSDVLLNSLPVTRQTVVKAKYVSGLLFLLLGLAASLLVGTGMHFLGFARGLANGETVLGMVIAPLLLLSLYYPVYFKFGYLKSRYYQIMVFLLAVFGPGILIGSLTGRSEGEIPPVWLATLSEWLSYHEVLAAACFLAAVLFLHGASLAVSVRFYQGREFS